MEAHHVTSALDRLLADAEAALASAVAPETPADSDALARVLDAPVERLRRVWGHIGHLHAVVDTPALREAYGDNLPRVTDFFTRLAADAALYAKTRAIADSPAFADLPAVRRKAVFDALRDFELGGAALQGAARERFAAIEARLAELSQRLGENVLDATDAWHLDVPLTRLAGVPADVLAAAQALAAEAGITDPAIARLTLHAPCRLPTLATADDRALRETLHRAHARLASELGDPAHDNGPLMQEILDLRQEQAALLGRPHHAAVSLAPKMAGSVPEVLDFLRDLAHRAQPFAARERAELQAHAHALGLDTVQPWDRAYVGEKLKQQRFGIDDEALRPWFPLPTVMQGLFALVQQVLGVRIEPAEAPAWHPDVSHHRVMQCDAQGGAEIGRFWLDPYARPGKQSGAWMDEVRSRWRRPDGRLQQPQAHLICNFAPPVGERPSLLTHDDVITLFHEFGHGLHHLLTEVDELSLSGIGGVEWDAAELPSQFMENFAWEWPVLQRLTAHVDTGEPLPRELFDRMTAARHFGAGQRMLRGVEYALLDMRLHAEAGTSGRVPALAREVEAELALPTRPDDDRWPNGFLHIFDGGYAAGYYGYHWAEVLSADAFAAFEANGLFDPYTGARWRREVLGSGGSRPAQDSFVAFRGRPARLDALLRHQGMAPDTTAGVEAGAQAR
ncbi:MAG: M3 family metallopeptidase [Burkholderiaceae bacterium]|nr:M3 family metallopeptidase [Burkholderiaceae bacterium]